jgi:MtN3 and saliva related transmembrane protein
MDSWLPLAVGVVAGALSSSSYVPQIRKILREGDTEAISLRMFALRAVGLTLWTIYGFGVGSLPVLIFSALNLAASATVLILKLRSANAPPPA